MGARAPAAPRAPCTLAEATAWMATRGFAPFAFQRSVWKAMRAGQSGLLHATTGAGKTLAVWLGALQSARVPAASVPPLTVLWVTPMRALAADTLAALNAARDALAPSWTSGLRTGDTTSKDRAAQNRRLPTVLVTTPESVTLLLARADARDTLATVQWVVVDEWHELLGSKRGVQVQLALARLRRFNPDVGVWGLSATLGNVEEALLVLSPHPPPDRPNALVRGKLDKTLVVDTLLPPQVERFAWGGHMGLQMVPQVAAAIDEAASTLVFTNTRSQSERWYQALLDHRPDWAGLIALHHGSLDGEVRTWVEAGLKDGRLRAVVCTASLDLGVDFLPVDRVLQIGSAKGIARLLQRAGRSGHAPGRPSRITLVPTHSLEIVEAAAARAAIAAGQIESFAPPLAPLDVLVQHLVTVALGGGFEPDALLAEVRRTHAYAGLSDAAWNWALLFVRQGGESLRAYPDFSRVEPDADGIWRVPSAALARRHRANIGTIVSDASISVQFVSGGKLGSVEESFIARLKPGDAFLFAGRTLELVRIHDMTAQVKLARSNRAALPRWAGARMPMSGTLGDAMLQQLAATSRGVYASAELRAARPLLALQAAWSHLPTPETLLAETLKSREGWHLFLYPFAGRVVHLGLATLLAWRAAQMAPCTFSIAINDYGLELLSAQPVDWVERLPQVLYATDAAALEREVLHSINASELAKRRFREIARIAGLIFQSHPGERRSNRQLQASSSLYYEVFKQHDPDNGLLQQAQTELLSNELDIAQLGRTLARMQGQRLVHVACSHATPLAFPLLVERFREQLSSESLADRLARMLSQLEEQAGPAGDRSSDAAAQAAPKTKRTRRRDSPKAP